MNKKLILGFCLLTFIVGLTTPTADLSAQDVDGRTEESGRDGFDWGWLGLLGLLGLLPRKPIEERHGMTRSP
jgi:hypothetical protein